ncbi:LysR family transcriptional regulator [Brevibacillus sp. NRS-1366]|uniref:LysR family transcriptional regulator n=1 Tax=Brevibacillus sp. NRS-1366 TaxID=3233899 RepID=UPI003D256922
MELRQLKYFITVAKELHFGRAAKLLQISQPPLSQQIKQLEEEMGVRLFHRTQRHVELTEAGKFFFARVNDFLENLNLACEQAQKIHRGKLGEIILGFTGTATYSILPKILHACKIKYPEIKIVLRELTTVEQVKALQEGQIHVGLLVPPIESDSIKVEVLREESFMVTLPKNHPLAKHMSPVDLASLANESFLMPRRDDGPGYYDAMVSLCYQAGFSPKIILEAKQYHTFISLVSSGIGIALLPSSIQFIDNEEIVFLPIKDIRPTWNTSVAWNKDNKSTILQVFISLIKESTTEPSYSITSQ